LVGWVLHRAEATLRVLVPGFGGLVEVSLLVGVLVKASLLGVWGELLQGFGVLVSVLFVLHLEESLLGVQCCRETLLRGLVLRGFSVLAEAGLLGERFRKGLLGAVRQGLGF
jgi:hypothetical protein